MRKCSFGMLLISVFCLCAATVAAEPSFFGPTGLIAMPTADSLGLAQGNVFLNYVDWPGSQEAAYGANVGVGLGIELGIAQVHDSEISGNELIVNAKWNFRPETALMPGIAVGAINLAKNKGFLGSFTTSDEGKINPYLVVSKQLSMPTTSVAISGHIGYIGGSIEELMLGASAQVTPEFVVMADYINDFSEFSIGASYAITDELRVKAASLDGNLCLGVSYGFGID